MKRLKMVSFLGLIALYGTAFGKTLTIYTERKDHLFKPVCEAYKEKTGISCVLLSDQSAVLIEKLKAEGTKSPADLLVTVDVGNLWAAAQAGLLEPTESPTLKAAVPEHLRDPGHQWYGLSLRARTIVYNPDKIKESELKGPLDLADGRFRKKLCLRSSKKVYNQSLVALLIAEHGESAVEKAVKGWVNNLAVPVFPDDTKLIEAVAHGTCEVGIVNTYYLGRLQAEKPSLKARLFFTPTSLGGTHVNISGAGIVKTSPNKAEALKFLEWLVTPEAQKIFADANFEYPVNPKVSPAQMVQSWGPLPMSTTPLVKAGELQEKAIKLMDRAGYQ
jgi:iron(III) transport system substrate-binding protein